jgi:hypothetical protein
MPFAFNRAVCGARTKSGGSCRMTPHANGRCRRHGGATPPTVCEGDRLFRGNVDAITRFHRVYGEETPLDWTGTRLTSWHSDGGMPTFAKRRLRQHTLGAIRDPYQETRLDPELEIQYRQATSQDLAEFVIPSWLQSYARSLVAKLLRADGRYSTGRDIYWSSQRKKIEQILSTPGVRVIVATVSDTSVGWTCEDRSRRVLHYCYVKDAFRKLGVARALIGWIDNGAEGVVRLTHLPPPWYSRPQVVPADEQHPARSKNLWAPHVVIDLISGV